MWNFHGDDENRNSNSGHERLNDEDYLNVNDSVSGFPSTTNGRAGTVLRPQIPLRNPTSTEILHWNSANLAGQRSAPDLLSMVIASQQRIHTPHSLTRTAEGRSLADTTSEALSSASYWATLREEIRQRMFTMSPDIPIDTSSVSHLAFLLAGSPGSSREVNTALSLPTGANTHRSSNLPSLDLLHLCTTTGLLGTIQPGGGRTSPRYYDEPSSFARAQSSLLLNREMSNANRDWRVENTGIFPSRTASRTAPAIQAQHHFVNTNVPNTQVHINVANYADVIGSNSTHSFAAASVSRRENSSSLRPSCTLATIDRRRKRAPDQSKVSSFPNHDQSTEVQTTRAPSLNQNPTTHPSPSPSSPPPAAAAAATAKMTPGEFDVLLGHRKIVFSHPGNLLFKELIANHRLAYDNASDRLSKKSITMAIVNYIRTEKNGSFLRYDQDGKTWIEVSTEEAREKVAHAFRDNRARVTISKVQGDVPRTT